MCAHDVVDRLAAGHEVARPWSQAEAGKCAGCDFKGRHSANSRGNRDRRPLVHAAGANPQTSFGLIGQGDSNPKFQSAVGALGPNVMYIFSSYNPPGDGGMGSTDYEVYVQAFDPKSGASKGPSKSLFVDPTANPKVQESYYVTSAAVAPSGEIALLYFSQIGTGKDLYAMFLSPSTAGGSSDGGSVDGLALQKVVLVSDGNPYVTYPGAPADHSPQVIWSKTSQTFIVSYNDGGGDFDYCYKYSSDGQVAGSSNPVPTNVPSNRSGQTAGSVGESGDLLGFAYGCGGGLASACLTILDESENLVGQPMVLANNLGAISWAGVAGTAKGFVYVYDGQQQSTQFPNGFVGEAFVSTSADGDVGVAGDGGVTTFPGFTFASRAIDGRAVADNIGTGGGAGVGLALVYDDTTVKFAYVSADGAGHLGPYTPATHSAQVIETGICP